MRTITSPQKPNPLKQAPKGKGKVAQLILLTLSPLLFSFTDPCQEIVLKTVKPPPAIHILNEKGDYAILDNKEKYELTKQYREEILKITDLLGKYIQLRKESEEIEAFLNWQWQRVRAGIEYKKDIWKEQIELNQRRAQLQNIETQLLLLGINKKDLEKCYRNR